MKGMELINNIYLYNMCDRVDTAQATRKRFFTKLLERTLRGYHKPFAYYYNNNNLMNALIGPYKS